MFHGSTWTVIWSALVFGILNTVLKPVLKLVTLPLALVTFGLRLVLRVDPDALADGIDHQRLRHQRVLELRRGDDPHLGLQRGD